MFTYHRLNKKINTFMYPEYFSCWTMTVISEYHLKNIGINCSLTYIEDIRSYTTTYKRTKVRVFFTKTKNPTEFFSFFSYSFLRKNQRNT